MKTNLLKTKEGIIALGEGDIAGGNVLTAGLVKKEECILDSSFITWNEFNHNYA